MNKIDSCDIVQIKHMCLECKKIFTFKSALNRHILLNRCKEASRKILAEHKELTEIICKQKNAIEQQHTIIEKQKTAIEKLVEIVNKQTNMRDMPNIFNNNLNVSVKDNDNYLDRLELDCDLEQALIFIKNCDLSRLSGDCKLLKKNYFKDNEHTFIYIDKKFNNYYDEHNNRAIETNSKVFAKK